LGVYRTGRHPRSANPSLSPVILRLIIEKAQPPRGDDNKPFGKPSHMRIYVIIIGNIYKFLSGITRCKRSLKSVRLLCGSKIRLFESVGQGRKGDPQLCQHAIPNYFWSLDLGVTIGCKSRHATEEIIRSIIRYEVYFKGLVILIFEENTAEGRKSPQVFRIRLRKS
jgi:hypothetical protein